MKPDALWHGRQNAQASNSYQPTDFVVSLAANSCERAAPAYVAAKAPSGATEPMSR